MPFEVYIHLETTLLSALCVPVFTMCVMSINNFEWHKIQSFQANGLLVSLPFSLSLACCNIVNLKSSLRQHLIYCSPYFHSRSGWWSSSYIVWGITALLSSYCLRLIGFCLLQPSKCWVFSQRNLQAFHQKLTFYCQHSSSTSSTQDSPGFYSLCSPTAVDLLPHSYQLLSYFYLSPAQSIWFLLQFIHIYFTSRTLLSS